MRKGSSGCGVVLVVILILYISQVFGAVTTAIVSGVPWYDTAGNRIEAHGGGWLLVGNTYYWYGESRKSSNASDHGINCYSSTDLYNWHFEGQILSQQDIKISTAGPYVVERPHVLYNKQTSTYVLWFHLDNSGYSLRNAGIATSKSPNTKFTFVKGFQPDGVGGLDQSVYQDPDTDDAYHVRSVENQYVGISKLTADYLSTTGITSKIGEAREGPALFKYNSNYYLITSHLSGWSPNAMELFSTGKTLVGAVWTSLGNPTNDATTFNSQSTNVLVYKGTYIYQGDRWNYSGQGGLLNATYIWLPILPSGNNFKITFESSWKLP